MAVTFKIVEADSSVYGGEDAKFHIIREGDMAASGAVQWNTVPGGAQDGERLGVATFNENDLAEQVNIPTKGDDEATDNNTVTVKLTTPLNGTISGETATITVKYNVIDPPVEPPVEPPIEPPIEPPVEPPTTGWPCSDPYMGPIKRLTTKKVMLLHRSWSHPALRSFEEIKNLITPTVYGMGSIYRIDGEFKHTSSGMDEHARRVWAFFKAKRWNDARSLWWDIESGDAFYKYNITPESARTKAVNWHAGVMQRMNALAAKEGFKNFEHGEYNMPSVPVLGKEGIEAIYNQMDDELQKPLFCPWASFGGPNAYFSGSNEQMAKWTLQQWVDRRVNMVKGVRKAFGPTQKIVPAIWAFWFTLEKPAQYPNGDRIVPAGYMYAMAKQLLDAGANGLIIWTSSGDDDNAELAARASKRYGEVVDLIQKRGDFIKAA